MRRMYMKYMRGSSKIIGIALLIIGFFIVIKFIPFEFILFILGISLLVMGGLILKIK